MTQKEFARQINANEKDLPKGDVDHYYKTYIEYVEPYLEFINHLIHNEKMSRDEVRRVLGVSPYEWRLFASMDTVKDYTMKSGKYMQAKIQKDFLDAKGKNQGNAKFHEMAFKRFDGGYGEKGEINVNVPEKIDFKFRAAGLTQEEIQNKAKGAVENKDSDS